MCIYGDGTHRQQIVTHPNLLPIKVFQCYIPDTVVVWLEHWKQSCCLYGFGNNTHWWCTPLLLYKVIPADVTFCIV